MANRAPSDFETPPTAARSRNGPKTLPAIPQHDGVMRLRKIRNTALAVAVLGLAAATACNPFSDSLPGDDGAQPQAEVRDTEETNPAPSGRSSQTANWDDDPQAILIPTLAPAPFPSLVAQATPVGPPERPPTPTPTRTVTEGYIEAFASCNGAYQGEAHTIRARTAKESLDTGRLSLQELAKDVATQCPQATAAVTAQSTPTPTPPPTPTLTPHPTHTPRPTYTPRPAPTPTLAWPTPDPTPTPITRNTHLVSHSAGKHQDLKQLMLRLTNQHRIAAGVPAVTMGRNPAAQLHVEAELDGCYTSHWDHWGLKPNHRYTLTGGTGADGENGSGLSYCITQADNYSPIQSMEQRVEKVVASWMDSPGHRRNLLNPAHTELNIGIAYDRYNTVMAQHFASDYVHYSQGPTIDDRGILTLSATVSDATLLIGDGVNIQIAHDPPPKALTRGQLSFTYSLCNSTPVAYLVEPLPPGWHFRDPEISTRTIQRKCVDPYETPASQPPPDSHDEAHQYWADAKTASAQGPDVRVSNTRIVAQSMSVTDSAISVKADIGKVLNDHGPGIYTVRIWGRPNHMAQTTPLSEQAIFWKTSVPPGAPY